MPKGKLTSKYDYLLQDQDFSRWYDNIKRGSIVTAHHWLRRIGYVHLKFGKTPKDMAKLDQKQATAFLLDIVSAFEREGKNGEAAENKEAELAYKIDNSGDSSADWLDHSELLSVHLTGAGKKEAARIMKLIE